MRPSSTALAAAGRAILHGRESLVEDWAGWMTRRLSSPQGTGHPSLLRQLTLLIDLLAEVTGPLRRQATDLWLSASEWYGRTAAERGLATGEVVEEFQHLRELLIVHLSELIAALPARQSLATVLRLNRALDQGIAHAVVGYTDSLFETLLNQRGVPVRAPGIDDDLAKRLTQFEQELADLRARAKRTRTESG
jgi:hypothetical protein